MSEQKQTFTLPEGALTVTRGATQTGFVFTAAPQWSVRDACFYDPGAGGRTEWAVEAVEATVIDGGCQ